MIVSFKTSLAAITLVAASSLPGTMAVAQVIAPQLSPVPKTEPQKLEPQKPAQTQRAPNQPALDKLFERLKSVKDADEAKGIERQITRNWARSGSDTADLLMSRAQEAAKARNFALSVELLDRVIALQPDWAEGWNQRANVFFRMEDHVRAALDVAETLKREPRHFGALVGLGQMLRAQGAEKSALKAYRRAYELHPFLTGVKAQIDKLSPDAEGRDA
jgi:tetratricopeptide (TPR) repeat protein